jgi:hypothetical protein
MNIQLHAKLERRARGWRVVASVGLGFASIREISGFVKPATFNLQLSTFLQPLAFSLQPFMARMGKSRM